MERLRAGDYPIQPAQLEPEGATSAAPDGTQAAPAGTDELRFHPCMAIARENGRQVTRCGHRYCQATDNYKRYALIRKRDQEELSGQRVPSREPYIASFIEHYCPGCAAMLQVDTFCPELDDENAPVRDFGLEGEGASSAPTAA